MIASLMLNCTTKSPISSFTAQPAAQLLSAICAHKTTPRSSRSFFRTNPTRTRTSSARSSTRWQGPSLPPQATLTSSRETTCRSRSGMSATISKPCRLSSSLTTLIVIWCHSTRMRVSMTLLTCKFRPAQLWRSQVLTTIKPMWLTCSEG